MENLIGISEVKDLFDLSIDGIKKYEKIYNQLVG